MSSMAATLTYGAETIHYDIRRVTSRKTLAIEVYPDGRVQVRAPADCPAAVIAERVGKRVRWIARQRAEFARYRPRTPQRQYVQGESHLYLGRQYRLTLLAGGASGVTLTRGRFLVCVAGRPDATVVQSLLGGWYVERARVVFEQVLEDALSHFRGADRPRLRVRAMRTRWGSLSGAGTMTLNVALVRAPRCCIEYVVVHELCHLTHRAHDARFYRKLAQVMPDWKQRKQRLEEALL
jgi:predicted metal-dependent hydrolase